MDDAASLSALARRTFADTFTGTCTDEDLAHFLEEYYNTNRMAAELSDPDDLIFFALSGDVPVAYMRFGVHEVPFEYDRSLNALELNRLYIDTGFQGKGVAQQLMNFYLQYARKHGYRFLWLGVWEHNLRAQAFYKKYGFAFNGHTHPFPIGGTPQTDQWWVNVIE